MILFISIADLKKTVVGVTMIAGKHLLNDNPDTTIV